MIETVITLLIFCAVAVLVRVIKGPTIQDIVLAANVFGTLIVLLVVAMSFYRDSFEFIDIAIVYALINFITTVAILKYIKYRSFND